VTYLASIRPGVQTPVLLPKKKKKKKSSSSCVIIFDRKRKNKTREFPGMVASNCTPSYLGAEIRRFTVRPEAKNWQDCIQTDKPGMGEHICDSSYARSCSRRVAI
jgi:hypothetical protein